MRIWRRCRSLTLAAAFCLIGAPTPSVAQPAATASAGKLLPVEVVVNQSKVGAWTLLELDGGLYANRETVTEWRLTAPPGTTPLNARGQVWLPLFAFPGYRSRFDPVNQQVELEFAPEAFAATRVASEALSRPELSPNLPALFLNYDLSHTRADAKGNSGSADTGALLEVGGSWSAGVLTSSYVGRNLAGTRVAAGSAAVRPEWRRLETTWTRDFPGSNMTLRLGDSSTRPSMWGRSVYFGGLQLARNFALTPGFLTQPIPSVSGTSSGPSTIELYVNDALRQTSSVPSGPFTLENIPVTTGGGEVRLVVRDVLGRETVISRPFFTHGDLLAEGLEDWSLDAGRVRLDLGTKNRNYGESFGSGLYRRGLSAGLTLETRGEWSRSVRNGGVGVVAGLPFQALGIASWTASQSDAAGNGTKWMLGVDQQRLRSGLAAKAGGASRGYRQIGFGATELPYRRELSASGRLTIGEDSAAGVSMAKIMPYDNPAVLTTSASWSTRIAERGSLVLSTTRVRGPTPGRSVTVSLMIPLDGSQTFSGSAVRRGPDIDAYASVNSPVGADTGAGWRVVAGSRSRSEYLEGGYYYQGAKALLTADANASRETQTVRVGAQGALVFLDGRLFASRRVQESFALVEVPGYEGVGVGFQGSVLTRTGADGRALLTRLMPYQRNGIRLDPNDLPFSAELDSIEEVAVPAWRSAVKVSFPVRSGRGALIRLVLEDGEPAPAGAAIELQGDNKEFFVARRGEAFVTGLQDRNTLRLSWKGAACTVEVQLPPGQPDEVPRVGPLVCKGVAR